MADIKSFFAQVKESLILNKETNDECVQVLKQAASNGNGEANGLLGDFFFSKGGKEDRELALKYYMASEAPALTPLRRKNVSVILKCNLSTEDSKKQAFESLIERKIATSFITIDMIDEIIGEAKGLSLLDDDDIKTSPKSIAKYRHWLDDFIMDRGYKIESCLDTWTRWISQKGKTERLDNLTTRHNFIKEYIRLKNLEQKLFNTSDINLGKMYENEASKLLNENEVLLFSPEKAFVEDVLTGCLRNEDLSKPLSFETFYYLKGKAMFEYGLSEDVWALICETNHLRTVSPNVIFDIPDLIGNQLKLDENVKRVSYESPGLFVKDIVSHAKDIEWLNKIVATYTEDEHLGKKFRIPLTTLFCNSLSEIPCDDSHVVDFENIAMIVLKFYNASKNVLGYKNIFLLLLEPWNKILSPSFLENVRKYEP